MANMNETILHDWGRVYRVQYHRRGKKRPAQRKLCQKRKEEWLTFRVFGVFRGFNFTNDRNCLSWLIERFLPNKVSRFAVTFKWELLRFPMEFKTFSNGNQNEFQWKLNRFPMENALKPIGFCGASKPD